jgi:sortase (surface protein transpeptidase)
MTARVAGGRHRTGRGLAVLVLALVCVAGLATSDQELGGRWQRAAALPVIGPAVGLGASETVAQAPVAQPVARPVSVAVPAIGVRSSLVGLRLDAGNELEVPADPQQAGWFAGGTVPGQPGPAVIAGHVDSYRGPGVFFRLRELAPGDTVAIGLSSGRSERFQVVSVDRYPKDRFPTQDVYGPTPAPELRLVTCGGSFDHTARSYRDNIIVYAALVG